MSSGIPYCGAKNREWIATADNKQMTLQDFIPVIARSTGPAAAEPQRIYREIRALAKPGPLMDDFSIVVLEFP